MNSKTIQVHTRPLVRLLKNLLEPTEPLFPKIAGAKRQYPGEQEGAYLASHLNGLSRAQKKGLWLPGLEAMQQLLNIPRELASHLSKDSAALQHAVSRKVDLRFGKAFIFQAELMRKIDRRGPARLTNEGLVIPPVSAEGRAALAALLLYRDRRLFRLRQCLNCTAWFYARFERQKFCNDGQKNCQWNHYHSSEWRKDHREANKKHQRRYRQRLFGKEK